jgi:ribosome-associated toxin RatA of RatAB toxin-antitoxin module
MLNKILSYGNSPMIRALNKNLANSFCILFIATACILVFSGFSTAQDSYRFKMPPPLVKTSLKEGQVILTGSNGQYLGQVVVKGSLSTTWAVLTDYENFKNFMPNVVESHLLQRNRFQTIFEQVQVFQVLFLSRREKVKLSVTEKYPKLIKFNVIEGYVKSLQGYWQIEPISSNLFLLTHQVSVEPDIKSSSNRKLFFAIYEDTLENTLKAVKEEIDRRSLSH